MTRQEVRAENRSGPIAGPGRPMGQAYLKGTEHRRGLFDIETPDGPKRFPPDGRIRFRPDSRRLFCRECCYGDRPQKTSGV